MSFESPQAVTANNARLVPLVWTATVEAILAKVQRGCQTLEAITSQN